MTGTALAQALARSAGLAADDVSDAGSGEEGVEDVEQRGAAAGGELDGLGESFR